MVWTRVASSDDGEVFLETFKVAVHGGFLVREVATIWHADGAKNVAVALCFTPSLERRGPDNRDEGADET